MWPGRMAQARKSLNFAAKMNGTGLPRELEITDDRSSAADSLNLFSLGTRERTRNDSKDDFSIFITVQHLSVIVNRLKLFSVRYVYLCHCANCKECFFVAMYRVTEFADGEILKVFCNCIEIAKIGFKTDNY